MESSSGKIRQSSYNHAGSPRQDPPAGGRKKALAPPVRAARRADQERALLARSAPAHRAGADARGAREPHGSARGGGRIARRGPGGDSPGRRGVRVGGAAVRAIAAALETIDCAAAGGKSAVDEDLALHRAIAEATGNAEFPRFLQFIGRHLIPRRTVSGLPEQMGGRRAYLVLIQEEHRRIYQAIESHDPKAAREAMRRHLTRSLERYRRLAAQRKAA